MKTKKTGKTMRVAGLLLALVLVTSCFVGGTFAKYVTSGGGTDHARVAKFGVTVDATGNDAMFAKQYDKAEGAPAALTAQYSVVSGNNDKVVAPGTKMDDCLSVSVTGTPEVAVEVDYDAVVNLTGKWEYKYTDAQGEHTEFYCPLVIKVGEQTFTGTDYNSVQEFTAAVAKAITDLSAVYPAGTDLSGSASKGFNVSWEWPFEGGTANAKQTDVKDTYLGNQAANLTGVDVPSVVIQAAVTVTQID